MAVLVTGGAGYIGSHTTLCLLQAGYDVVILDNFSNSSPVALDRVGQLCERPFTFVEGNIRDRALLDRIFHEHEIDAVIHFAGLKAVGESVSQPLRYYDNNVAGSGVLFDAMTAAGVFKIVFSSSATVYGDPGVVPYVETMPMGHPSSPYGWSKLMVEQMLNDLCAADERWTAALLRYFNPVGAHPSGLIGEDPNGIPNNLLPYIAQVAVGRLERLHVYGHDYDTPDGTGMRDYLHVMDLADGHMKALEAIMHRTGSHLWNLGTGHGTSVLDMVKAFEAASGQPIPYEFSPRRPGDIAAFWADPSKAREELGWVAERSVDCMMRDTWHWQSQNPKGYKPF